MARAQNPDSAGSQFFVCVDRAASLDNQYTVFGQVVVGMDVADVIVHAECDPAAGQNHPKDPVVIKKMTVFTGDGEMTPAEKEAWNSMDPSLKSRK